MSNVILSHPLKPINGTILLPASKSLSNRALILQQICNHPIQLSNLSTADDTLLMQTAFNQKSGSIQLKNAGTCMRFLTAYFAATPNSEVTLLCDTRMEQRPIKELIDALKQLGATIEYLNRDGFPPLHIKGQKLNGGNIQLSASASSQFISALMMIAPLCKQPLSIELIGEVTSKPYIEMTAQMMREFGFNIELDFPFIHIPNTQNSDLKTQITSYLIEPDWSAASYWYQLIALSKDGEIVLSNLSLNGLQGDETIASFMEQFGVQTTQQKDGISIKKILTNYISEKPINLANCPDLAPTLAVTAAATNRHLTLTGLQNLVIKESNRLEAIQAELTKLGFIITITNDSLTVHKKECTVNHSLFTELPKNTIKTFNDHRLAMAFAPLAFLFDEIMIEHPEVVAKSYPHFWEDLKIVGFELAFI